MRLASIPSIRSLLASSLGFAALSACTVDNPDHCEIVGVVEMVVPDEDGDGSGTDGGETDGGGTDGGETDGGGTDGGERQTVEVPPCDTGYCTVGSCRRSPDGCVAGEPARDRCWVDHCWQNPGTCGPNTWCTRRTSAEPVLEICGDDDAVEGWAVPLEVDEFGCAQRRRPIEQDGTPGQAPALPADLVSALGDDLEPLDPRSKFCSTWRGDGYAACQGLCPIRSSQDAR